MTSSLLGLTTRQGHTVSRTPASHTASETTTATQVSQVSPLSLSLPLSVCLCMSCLKRATEKTDNVGPEIAAPEKNRKVN